MKYSLSNKQLSLVLNATDGKLSIEHFGLPLPIEDDLIMAGTGSLAHAFFDDQRSVSFYREESTGFQGKPAVLGHRRGRSWSHSFEIKEVVESNTWIEVVSEDLESELAIRTRFALTESGLLLIDNELSNTGSEDFYLEHLASWIPIPQRAVEVMDFTGRWSKERQPQRFDIQTGSFIRQSREGRSGHDYTILQLALTKGADFSSGEFWSMGLAWSGNIEHNIERLPDGYQAMGAGELLLPGEVILTPGQSYKAPTVVAGYSAAGLDALSYAHHEWIRSLPAYPKPERPLTLNVWEAVFFDHNFAKISELVDAAKEIGVERVVLDDGWFGSRRDDTSGLGDWIVSKDVWPEGLEPLVKRIRSSGMQFGLWFEGEMVNPDSEIYRAHPDWAFGGLANNPRLARHQLVLDLTNQEAFDYIFNQVNSLVQEYGIDYIKWDHNRVLTQASHLGKAAVRNQTLAIYKLFDDLKSSNPGLEIESCASGGGRIDLGMVFHADRFWTSDNNDPLERQLIQRYTQLAIPPELLGSHIGPRRSHQTGRAHTLSFRAITALFGHAGIEWDLTETNHQERESLKLWANYYKQKRELIRTGKVIRQPESESLVHGIVAKDKSEAIFSYVQLQTAPFVQPGRFTLSGLDADTKYQVKLIELGGEATYMHRAKPAWFEGIILSGQSLMSFGLAAPVLAPENAVLIELTAK
jgi:alpha-galactosidase